MRMVRTLDVEVHPFVDTTESLAAREAKACLHFADAWDTWERFTLPRDAPDFPAARCCS